MTGGRQRVSVSACQRMRESSHSSGAGDGTNLSWCQAQEHGIKLGYHAKVAANFVDLSLAIIACDTSDAATD